MNRREIRKLIADYFREVSYLVEFVKSGKQVLVYVEYRDFRPEQVVESELHGIIGKDCVLCIKRECSESLVSEIKNLFLSEAGRRKLLMHLMSSYVPGTV